VAKEQNRSESTILYTLPTL